MIMICVISSNWTKISITASYLPSCKFSSAVWSSEDLWHKDALRLYEKDNGGKVEQQEARTASAMLLTDQQHIGEYIGC
jgi:hypothetical protein